MKICYNNFINSLSAHSVPDNLVELITSLLLIADFSVPTLLNDLKKGEINRKSLLRTPFHELVLTGWTKGSVNDFHTPNPKNCIYQILHGRMLQTRKSSMNECRTIKNVLDFTSVPQSITGNGLYDQHKIEALDQSISINFYFDDSYLNLVKKYKDYTSFSTIARNYIKKGSLIKISEQSDIQNTNN